jgi:hypothetical protein
MTIRGSGPTGLRNFLTIQLSQQPQHNGSLKKLAELPFRKTMQMVLDYT